jgi:hypothetical protein
VAGLFSYNEIKDVSVSTTVFCLSENALFSKNTTDQIKTMIDGLSGQTILLQPFDKTLVGYENGLIVVINEAGRHVESS